MPIYLTAPLIIGPRLLPALRVEDAFLSLEAIDRDTEGRVVYRWTIDLPDGTSHTGDDLGSGVGSPVDYRDTMRSLLSFLGACAESGEDGEHADLFPAPVREWAEANADEIGMLAYEIETGDEERK